MVWPTSQNNVIEAMEQQVSKNTSSLFTRIILKVYELPDQQDEIIERNYETISFQD